MRYGCGKTFKGTVSDEWLEWYAMSPSERWRESGRLWSFYLEAGGRA